MYQQRAASSQKIEVKKTFILSTQEVNSYGFIVLTSGIDLEDFKKNPAMLFNHNPNKIPGKWDNIRVENNQLIADTLFDEKDSEAQAIANKVEGGFLNGASIGIDIIEIVLGALAGFDDYVVVTKCKLREASLTPTPSNCSALKLYRDGKEITQAELQAQFITLSNNNQNQNNIEMKKFPFLVAALGLAEGATEDQVLDAVKTLKAEHAALTKEKTELSGKVSTLETAQKTTEEANITALVDGAITTGKIKTEDKDRYVKLAKQDFATTKAILDSMQAHKTLSSQLEQDKIKAAEKFKDFDYKKFHREAPKELARIKKDEPVRYKELFDAAYPKA